jgi:hypothetical protein
MPLQVQNGLRCLNGTLKKDALCQHPPLTVAARRGRQPLTDHGCIETFYRADD